MSNLGVGVTVTVTVDNRRVPVLVQRDGETYSTQTLFSSDKHLESTLSWDVVRESVTPDVMRRINSLIVDAEVEEVATEAAEFAREFSRTVTTEHPAIRAAMRRKANR